MKNERLNNPYFNVVSMISASEFEQHCFDIIKSYAESESLSEFTITHDAKIKADDGEYQIDVYAEFVALSVRFKVLIECKRYTRPVERDKIITLCGKVQSLGAHKGILISTSGFQSGAVQYANKHGIALIQVLDKDIIHLQMSDEIPPQYIEFVRQSPPYYAYLCSGSIMYGIRYNENKSGLPYKKIYPSESMDTVLRRK